MKNLSKDIKVLIIAIAGVAIMFVGVLFWIGVADSVFSDNRSSNQSSGSSSSSGLPASEQDYLDLLYAAHAADGDSGHTFASDQYAIIHGYTVCELLDDYYVETIADSIAYNNEGILWKVSIESKAYGLASAAAHLCPEHSSEVRAWLNN